jgi:hypothetical protein
VGLSEVEASKLLKQGMLARFALSHPSNDPDNSLPRLCTHNYFGFSTFTTLNYGLLALGTFVLRFSPLPCTQRNVTIPSPRSTVNSPEGLCKRDRPRTAALLPCMQYRRVYSSSCRWRTQHLLLSGSIIMRLLALTLPG